MGNSPQTRVDEAIEKIKTELDKKTTDYDKYKFLRIYFARNGFANVKPKLNHDRPKSNHDFVQGYFDAVNADYDKVAKFIIDEMDAILSRHPEWNVDEMGYVPPPSTDTNTTGGYTIVSLYSVLLIMLLLYLIFGTNIVSNVVSTIINTLYNISNSLINVLN